MEIAALLFLIYAIGFVITLIINVLMGSPKPILFSSVWPMFWIIAILVRFKGIW